MTGEKEKIIRAGREMYDRGLVAGTWGNISIRLDENLEKFAITPTGMDYREIEKEDIAILNLEGEKIEGREDPSSENPLHRFIYKARENVNAILHTHSTFASAVACTREDIPPLIEDMVQIVGGKIETAKYELPGTEDLAKAAVETLKDKNATLLANHGAVAVGPDIDTALMAGEIVEKSAKIFTISKMLGEPKELSEEDVEIMREIFSLKFKS